ncbi:hypothetical protein DFH06DRAFT_1136826 [Mycena polygramma]|nr:hypothetical protein DFH06DRAFT_1136826 [Mycena polygramma]
MLAAPDTEHQTSLRERYSGPDTRLGPRKNTYFGPDPRLAPQETLGIKLPGRCSARRYLEPDSLPSRHLELNLDRHFLASQIVAKRSTVSDWWMPNALRTHSGYGLHTNIRIKIGTRLDINSGYDQEAVGETRVKLESDTAARTWGVLKDRHRNSNGNEKLNFYTFIDHWVHFEPQGETKILNAEMPEDAIEANDTHKFDFSCGSIKSEVVQMQ